MKDILGNIIASNKAFNLIEPNDKICVGVSGGKDSMLLLYELFIFRQMVQRKFNWTFDIVGVHLKLNLCAISYDEIIQFWKEKNIEFHIVDSTIDDILKAKLKKNKIQCSLCSKVKKAVLIDWAKKLNCNKIAMGHHADDAIETFFMNLINEGRIATFKPKIYLNRSKMTFIRPFIFAREKEIKKHALKLNIPIIPCGCPMEGFTQRDKMKDFLNQYFYQDKKWKIAYKNFLIALMNAKECDLWFTNDDKAKNNFKLIFDMIKR